jgi:predicted metal-dependent hydrolase
MPENRSLRDDPRFRKGVELFDRQEFFEAHEEWEALWHETRGEPRDFIQGLIQVTSAMHHLRKGNMRGARELHDSGLRLLEPYGETYSGVDLSALRLHFNRALAEILDEPYERLAGRSAPSAPVKIAYTPDRAFKIPFIANKV